MPDKAPQSPTEREILKSQMITYATGVFSEVLKREGFISYGNENLSWYRVVNNEILQTVYFYSTWRFPFQVSIGYGMHPLFVPAPLPEKIYISRSDQDNGEINCWLRSKALLGPKFIYPGTQINCLATPECGVEILRSELFSVFDANQTAETVYAYWYKHLYIPGTITPTFVDQGIAQKDRESYRYLYGRTQDWHKWISKKARKTPRDLKIIAEMELRMEAMQNGTEDAYVATVLEERKRKFTMQLEKKLGIKV